MLVSDAVNEEITGAPGQGLGAGDVCVGVGVGEGEGVNVAVFVGVKVRMPVGVFVGVLVGVLVGVEVGVEVTVIRPAAGVIGVGVGDWIVPTLTNTGAEVPTAPLGFIARASRR
jgi:hypothetical protein